MLRWRLNEVMARLRITNQELGEAMGRHEVSISRMRSTDSMPRLDGEALNLLCNALTAISRDRGVIGMIGPNDLFEYVPDDDLARASTDINPSVNEVGQSEAGGQSTNDFVSLTFNEAA
ncbi:MAG: XRE family transcriptional regulator [Leptolyngbya sp. SIO1E4]|nr:XRE family transcriptional regulator [Leptolyngbya sp. SIO1E4]